jgi:hypothetical protein
MVRSGCVLLVVTIGWAAATPVAGGDSVRSHPLLFVHGARSGSLTPVAGEPDNYVLSLRGVTPTALFFQDRPGRGVGTISLKWMLRGFFSPKHEAPPNAAVSVDRGPSKPPTVMALELRSAKYDATRHRLRYAARALHQIDSGLPESVRSRSSQVLPRHFGPASVFVDTLWNHCEASIQNNTGVAWTLTNSYLYPTDIWGADAGYNAPYSLTVGSLSLWGDSSGFGRGCKNIVAWTAPDGSVLLVTLADPYSGANTYTCQSSNPAYVCTINTSSYVDGGSEESGDLLEMVFVLSNA